EDAAPGRVDQAKAEAFLAAARGLGEAVNPTGYPTVAAIGREVYFNESGPFWKAWVAYLAAGAFLAVALMLAGFDRRSWLGKSGRALYALGLAALVTGIGLEALGFYLRVRISGWAPVTNMYETVIWVAVVAAVIGLVLEAIYRKVAPALAGS